MITPRRFWTCCGLVLIPIAMIALFVLLSSVEPSPLPVVSYNANFGVSVRCTFGTNHVYYYGDRLDRLLDRPSDDGVGTLTLHTGSSSTLLIRLQRFGCVYSTQIRKRSRQECSTCDAERLCPISDG